MATRVRLTAAALGVMEHPDALRFADYHTTIGEEGELLEDWKPAPTLEDWKMVQLDSGYFCPVHPSMFENVTE
jgi:hypothetical protein